MPAQAGGRAPSLDKDPRRIAGMFDAIAHRYDQLNHLLSAGLDRRWRRVAVDALELTDLAVLNNENEAIQKMIAYVLPDIVRWLTSYRAPGRFCSLFLASHGLKASGTLNNTVMLTAVLMKNVERL